MKVKFYFDPSCPFSWITSRWLLQVIPRRNINVQWQPFSLALKNDELGKDDGDKYTKHHQASHRVLRVMQAAADKHSANLFDMYNYVGYQFHVEKKNFADRLIVELLSAEGLPTELAQQANNKEIDPRLAEYVTQATDVVGQDVGVPIIVFVDEGGREQGYFGPVLQTLPSDEEAFKLWDGLSSLATSRSFYELKRQRPAGRPDVNSTVV